MKHLLEAANIAARKARFSDSELEKINDSIEKTEKEITKKQYELGELRLDREHMDRMRSQRHDEWQAAMKDLKDSFSKQERFRNAPSEEINRAFSEEILPDLDDL